MSRWEMKIIASEAQRLMALAAGDEGLRAELRALAQELLAATEAPPPHTVVPEGPAAELAPAAEERPAPPNPQGQGLAQADRPPLKEPLRELTLGRPRLPPVPTGPRHLPEPTLEPAAIDAELSRIGTRCRQKAEGARWAASRVRRIREGGELQTATAPEDTEILLWADRLVDRFSWANAPDASHLTEVSLLDNIGGCFETVAEAIALVNSHIVSHRGRLEQSLPLLAEAQSALRAAILGIQSSDDPDQLHVFEWLRTAAARRHIYIKRYMRSDDPAEPSAWPELRDRIDEFHARTQQTHGRARQREALADRLRPHLKRIGEGQATESDWHEVIKTVDELITAGVPPSNRQIRDLLLPVIDDLPERDDLPQGFRRVLQEVDRFLALRKSPSGAGTGAGAGAGAEAAAAPEQQQSQEVKDARRLLAGRSMVLIGGICHRDAQRLLESALGLKELVWIETKEHQSIAAFESAIARPDVALVLLAIRWTSHAFGDVKQFCDRHGKPLVRLPGGYNPNQVATQILAQCSEQLAGR
jgi:hypothetical protein